MRVRSEIEDILRRLVRDLSLDEVSHKGMDVHYSRIVWVAA